MTAADINDHPLRDTLRQIREARNWEQVLETTPGTNSAWLLERIFQFGDLVVQRLDGTPPFLISGTGLASVNNALQAVLTGLNNFRAAPSESALVEANQSIDTAMQSLWAIPTTVVGDAQTAMAQASVAYFEQAQKSIAMVGQKTDELAERLDGLSIAVAEAGRLAGLVGDTIAQQKTEAGAINAEVKRDFAKTDLEYRERFSTLVDEQRASHAITVADLQKKADDALEVLESKRDEAARIVQIVGNIGVTGNYQRIAEREGTKADNWRLISFIVLVAATVFGGYTLLEFSKDELKWVTAIVRMLFAFVIASISLYTARESARHRSNADTARRRELELASLGPFIESLPKEMQEEIRKKLTDLYFGGETAPHTIEPAIPVKAVTSIVDKVVDGVVDVAKAKLR